MSANEGEGGSALVIGAGIAGLTVASSLSGMGIKVHLVEREKELGGRVIRSKALFPGMNDARVFIKERLEKVISDPNITVHAQFIISQVDRSEVFEVEIAQVLDLNEKGCTGLRPERVGAVVIATGLEGVDASIIPELGYGRLRNVVTSVEFEDMLDPHGPSEGKVLRPSDHAPATSVAFIQCVGSRVEKRGVPYCSTVCCANAIKSAILLKEMDVRMDVYILYIDVRTHGKGYEALYKKGRERGVKFIRGQPSMVTKVPRSEQVLVLGENTLLKELYEIPVDLVVLAIGLKQRESNRELFEMLGVRLDKENLVQNPGRGEESVLTTAPGVFVAGSVEAPKDIRDTIVQAEAAALATAKYLGRL